jgi:molybdate transport system ATP-binding protein
MGLAVELRKKVNGFALDVAWEIGNELAVLFGFSGAGKSLTLQLIAGLLTPDDGHVQLGEEVYFDSRQGLNVPPQRRSFGYLFQDLALFPHMRALENIMYGATGIAKGERLDRAGRILKAFHLEGLERKFPAEISGGEKQRVAFARALIRSPTVLLLDEPFSSLDNPLRLEMRWFLMEIRKEFDIPVVLVTHDLVEACTLADRMIVYSRGKIAQVGAVADVLNCPVNGEVELLVNRRNLDLPPYLGAQGPAGRLG